MRIFAGKYKGRTLKTHKDASVRPTTGRVREAMFNILTQGQFGDTITGANILDLFCGNGAFAFEALSRGANHAYLIDKNPELIKIVKNNAEKLDEIFSITCFCSDAALLPYAREAVDIVFLDPPYFKDLAAPAIDNLYKKNWLKDDSLIIYESSSKENFTPAKYLELVDERSYGNCKIRILKKTS